MPTPTDSLTTRRYTGEIPFPDGVILRAYAGPGAVELHTIQLEPIVPGSDIHRERTLGEELLLGRTAVYSRAAEFATCPRARDLIEDAWRVTCGGDPRVVVLDVEHYDITDWSVPS